MQGNFGKSSPNAYYTKHGYNEFISLHPRPCAGSIRRYSWMGVQEAWLCCFGGRADQPPSPESLLPLRLGKSNTPLRGGDCRSKRWRIEIFFF